ncbi:hypothetical protein ACLOJK_013979 [Asimina triloba]
MADAISFGLPCSARDGDGDGDGSRSESDIAKEEAGRVGGETRAGEIGFRFVVSRDIRRSVVPRVEF